MRIWTLPIALGVLICPQIAFAGALANSSVSNPLTQGNVQLNLKVGATTKSQVLEVFGAPNITTRDGSGREVWSYQRHATVSQSKEKDSFWTIFLAGGSSKTSGFSETMRTMTLIIKFDSSDVVADFMSRSSEF